ncbi:MAG: UDP-N-acetylglucosamine 1-carboxyvinyltransferase [Bacteroidales bacterium]|nr:UDP-N-acetylglucosamine 1-carboxyvinyltransferase [Bacteroidales bacterium]
MSSFSIKGGKRLAGEIIPQGAKNEALQVISAVLLTSEEIIIHNIPDILDVNRLIQLLGEMGVKTINLGNGSWSFTASDIRMDYLNSEDFVKRASSLRGSIMLMGPLCGRFKKAIVPRPGGDKIGRRRLDTHFTGLLKMGARVDYNSTNGIFSVNASNLEGAYILLDEASVTGTANVIMAACMAKGRTRIFNAACEPYIVQLCKMLNAMGAKISGIGSNLLYIDGVDSLGGCSHTLLPDMIEVGSFIGLAAMTRSAIRIKNCGFEHLGMIPDIFGRLGIQIEKEDDDIIVPAADHYRIENFMDGSILTIADAPWPGFTPDLISIALVVATQAQGSILIHQKMFESRLFFVDKLIDMGARIILCDPHRATVIGLGHQVPLRGIRMSSPDIRAGVALLIAALSAEGTSIIDNIEQIDRGYQNIDGRLRALGADISRIS